MLISDMWDDEDDERYCQENCHHWYGWSSNCRCLLCGTFNYRRMYARYRELMG